MGSVTQGSGHPGHPWPDCGRRNRLRGQPGAPHLGVRRHWYLLRNRNQCAEFLRQRYRLCRARSNARRTRPGGADLSPDPLAAFPELQPHRACGHGQQPGNSLYLYTTDLAPHAELRGSFATDRKPKTEHFANKFGALTCAYYFRKYLQDTGWEVTGSYADVDRSGHIRPGSFVPEEKAGEPTVLGETVSAPIADIARITNVRSDNFYAEALFRAMGEDRTGVALFDSCLVAQRQVLTELNVDPDGVRQVDGCGLSRMNYVSPEWMVGFLQAMQQSPAFGAFLSSLPHPGEGTLSALLPSQAGRERICIKSGSMDGVLCYSGYILAPDGTPEVTLSIMVLAHLLKLLMEEI